MGKIKPSEHVKIIVGLIAKDVNLFNNVAHILSKKLGSIDMESQILRFDHTAYYQKEMGEDLKRKFISFSGLKRPDGIEKIKIFTNKIEKRFSKNGGRSVNIDPGYITLAKLVLLTTKDYSHRVYIGKGIYAEATLYFKDGRFCPWEWSYPDYKSAGYENFFLGVRNTYKKQIGNSNC